jgi:hypothetical protein
MEGYKTFCDLEFLPHPNCPSSTQCRLHFSNGYGVSVITGEIFYTDSTHPYEMAVLKDGGICYDTPITTDVLGYLTQDDVTKHMIAVQELPHHSGIIELSKDEYTVVDEVADERANDIPST